MIIIISYIVFFYILNTGLLKHQNKNSLIFLFLLCSRILGILDWAAKFSSDEFTTANK